jgi:hypothetical protein
MMASRRLTVFCPYVERLSSASNATSSMKLRSSLLSALEDGRGETVDEREDGCDTAVEHVRERVAYSASVHSSSLSGVAVVEDGEEERPPRSSAGTSSTTTPLA